ncbi:hypothetical protein [Actinomadura algeriensis]|uniref:Uncharacterized protein n=1 Tax=Actinomadura algeriensis TaxID=1679523 RepID=A0ABR9JWP9_9ACTN|nr:hypothetical protein [Actinomadura algeriensis]MBE1534809.1 hypothetical protein [Actinomadura algeriensis]
MPVRALPVRPVPTLPDLLPPVLRDEPVDGPDAPVAAGGSPQTSQNPSTIVPPHPALSHAPLGALVPPGAPDVAEPVAAGGEPQTSQKPSTIVPPHPG